MAARGMDNLPSVRKLEHAVDTGIYVIAKGRRNTHCVGPVKLRYVKAVDNVPATDQLKSWQDVVTGAKLASKSYSSWLKPGEPVYFIDHTNGTKHELSQEMATEMAVSASYEIQLAHGTVHQRIRGQAIEPLLRWRARKYGSKRNAILTFTVGEKEELLTTSTGKRKLVSATPEDSQPVEAGPAGDPDAPPSSQLPGIPGAPDTPPSKRAMSTVFGGGNDQFHLSADMSELPPNEPRGSTVPEVKGALKELLEAANTLHDKCGDETKVLTDLIADRVKTKAKIVKYKAEAIKKSKAHAEDISNQFKSLLEEYDNNTLEASGN